LIDSCDCSISWLHLSWKAWGPVRSTECRFTWFSVYWVLHFSW